MVIEVDGSIHLEKDVLINDIQREDVLKELGLYIIRFTNEDVEKRLEFVIEKIETFIINNRSVSAS